MSDLGQSIVEVINKGGAQEFMEDIKQLILEPSQCIEKKMELFSLIDSIKKSDNMRKLELIVNKIGALKNNEVISNYFIKHDTIKFKQEMQDLIFDPIVNEVDRRKLLESYILYENLEKRYKIDRIVDAIPELMKSGKYDKTKQEVYDEVMKKCPQEIDNFNTIFDKIDKIKKDFI